MTETTSTATDATAATDAATTTAQTTAAATDAGTASAATPDNAGEHTGTDTSESADTGKDPAAGAPETYADFEVPEGVLVYPELMERYKAAAKAMNLTQEQAQGLASMGAEMAQKIHEDARLNYEKTIADWEAQTRADTEIGGDQLDANLAIGKQALEAFGTPALTQLLTDSGYGNHPEIIKFFVKVGKAISEDTLLPAGSTKPAGEQSLAQKLYPNMNP